MVAVLARPLPSEGFHTPSPGIPPVASPYVLLPNDSRGQASDYAGIEEQSPLRLRFVRPIVNAYQYCSPGSRYRFQTDATQVTFTVAYNNLVTRYDARNYIAVVLINGAVTASFDSRDVSYVLDLVGATSRLIELVWPYADGMDLIQVSVNVGANFFTPAARPSGKLVTGGDSITHGFTTTKITDTWAYKLAVLKSRQLVNIANGGAIAVAADANALIGTGADRVTYMIGYNNFGAQTALATFQAAVEGWINNAEANLPTAKIYIVSPIYSPNTNTITLAQYRTSAAAAVTAAGGANVTYVNGLSIMTNNVDRLVDNIHPNDLGAGEIATALAAIVAA
ncbi:SGNH/GDSL hydrolase family protein [Rhizobium ruizarguesonis]|uniref:SGNH/GDSL hydrolase family protein n=1 Tax=Rhizobium ruizarguesonis TaxID=2081791 RepID=A0ACD5EMK1_9HYPH|nr:GDSL-type esterase/lipase family protein [Rhizobium leguminosarum]